MGLKLGDIVTCEDDPRIRWKVIAVEDGYGIERAQLVPIDENGEMFE